MILLLLTGLIVGTILVSNFYIQELADQARRGSSCSHKSYPSYSSSRANKKPVKKAEVQVVDVTAPNLDKLLEDTIQTSLKRKAPDLYKLDSGELRTLHKKWEDTYLAPFIYQVRQDKVREALADRKIRKRYIADIKNLHNRALYSSYSTKHLKKLLDYYLAHQQK